MSPEETEGQVQVAGKLAADAGGEFVPIESRSKTEAEGWALYEEATMRILARFPIEQRLTGLTPEEIRAELSADEGSRGLHVGDIVRLVWFHAAIEALPVEVLRGLRDDLVERLLEPTRSVVRGRRGR